MSYAVIFDMDGVLLDSAPIHMESWKHLGAQNGLPVSEEFFHAVFGQTSRVILPLFFQRPLSEEEIARHTATKESLYRKLIAGRAHPLPGLLPLVRGLHAAGCRLAVGSSGPRDNVLFILRELGLEPYFSAFTSSEEVRHGKPDPEVFLLAAAKLGVPPSRCIVVEDSIHGLEAARAARMQSIAITTTFPAEKLGMADRVVESFAELTPAEVFALVDPPGAPRRPSRSPAAQPGARRQSTR